MDLYYRLSVVGIELPPLRERRQDIDALTRHFIDKSYFIMGARAESVSPEVMELFLNYDWPGNVRELAHVIEGALNIMDQGKVIDIDYLPVHFSVIRTPDHQGPGPADGVYQLFPVDGQDRLLEGLTRLKSPETEAEFQEEISLTAVQARREKEMIQKALEEVKGNVSQAARRLGISRQLLHYKVKKFGIARKTFK